MPFPDTDAMIVDLETGEEEMPFGEPGELIVRGPQVMRGYWHCPEETGQVLRNGWLYTGDIATQDEDGFFFIVDRKKDMIIVGGFNVYPRDIEEVLFQHPKVAEAVAVGLPDDYRGERVKAYVVLRPGEEANAEELILYCRETWPTTRRRARSSSLLAAQKRGGQGAEARAHRGRIALDRCLTRAQLRLGERVSEVQATPSTRPCSASRDRAQDRA